MEHDILSKSPTFYNGGEKVKCPLYEKALEDAEYITEPLHSSAFDATRSTALLKPSSYSPGKRFTFFQIVIVMLFLLRFKHTTASELGQSTDATVTISTDTQVSGQDDQYNDPDEGPSNTQCEHENKGISEEHDGISIDTYKNGNQGSVINVQDLSNLYFNEVEVQSGGKGEGGEDLRKLEKLCSSLEQSQNKHTLKANMNEFKHMMKIYEKEGRRILKLAKKEKKRLKKEMKWLDKVFKKARKHNNKMFRKKMKIEKELKLASILYREGVEKFILERESLLQQEKILKDFEQAKRKELEMKVKMKREDLMYKNVGKGGSSREQEVENPEKAQNIDKTLEKYEKEKTEKLEKLLLQKKEKLNKKKRKFNSKLNLFILNFEQYNEFSERIRALLGDLTQN